MPPLESGLTNGPRRTGRITHRSRTESPRTVVLSLACVISAFSAGCGGDKKTPPAPPPVVVPTPPVVASPPDVDPGMPTAAGIDPETVAAFDKSGASLAAFATPDDGLWVYVTVVDPDRYPTIPAFSFPASQLPKGLPEVNAPFGVVFLVQNPG